VIPDKTPETIIQALKEVWINGGGIGPGMPARHFMSDNGREFCNSKFTELLQAYGISLRTTPLYSLQMNGVNERNHATADIMVRKILDDNPEKNTPTSRKRSNLQITAKGFSPFQLIWGQNPTIPGLSECKAGSLKEVVESQVARNIIQAQTQNMIKAIQVEYDNKLKIAMRDRLPKESDIPFNIGDSVIYFNNRVKRKRKVHCSVYSRTELLHGNTRV